MRRGRRREDRLLEAGSYADTPAQDLDELHSILVSMRFEP